MLTEADAPAGAEVEAAGDAGIEGDGEGEGEESGGEERWAHLIGEKLLLKVVEVDRGATA